MRAGHFQLFLTVCVCTSGVFAQQTVDKKAVQPVNKSGKSPASEAEKMATPQLGPEIERLVKAFSGTWSVAIKIEPSERMPKGGGGKGEEVWRLGPAGLSLIEEYHSTGAEGMLSGLGVAWWNKDEQKYQFVWCDITNPAGCIVMKHGAKWEGNQVVVMDESDNTAKKFLFKEVFSFITANSFTQSLYQSELGGDFKKLLTITATKQKTLGTPQPGFTLKSSESPAQRLNMPGPAVQNNMLGRWSLTIKYEPSAEVPNGATGSATEWWAGPGGYKIVKAHSRENSSNWRKGVQSRCRNAPFCTLVGFSESRATLLE